MAVVVAEGAAVRGEVEAIAATEEMERTVATMATEEVERTAETEAAVVGIVVTEAVVGIVATGEGTVGTGVGTAATEEGTAATGGVEEVIAVTEGDTEAIEVDMVAEAVAACELVVHR